jgi:hypothetical protein
MSSFGSFLKEQNSGWSARIAWSSLFIPSRDVVPVGASFLLRERCRAEGDKAVSQFEATHVERSATITLVALPEQVFPLFEPVGEKAWAAEWDPRFVYPQDGETGEGAVFRVEAESGPDTIWVISRYDRERHVIEYLTVKPDTRVGRIRIEVAGGSDGTSAATVTYTFTALTEQGNALNDGFTEQHYRHKMHRWEKAINHYLRTGETLTHHD